MTVTNNAHTARARGAAIEQIAAQWLAQQGLTLITQNHYVKGGELDLVMRDGDILVFIEVKHRTTTRYGHPLETVTYQKQQRLVRAASFYLHRHGLWDRVSRIDVIGITPGQSSKYRIQWIKNAIQAD